VARVPKSTAIDAEDLRDAVQQLEIFLQEKPLATAALLTVALAVGAGANSLGQLPLRRAAAGRPKPSRLPPPVDPAPTPAPTPVSAEVVPRPARRLPRRRKGLGVATFELDQTGPDGRRTAVDFTWTGPKRKPGVEPEPVRREPRVGVALFEFSHSRPGGKDTGIKFGWSKEPLEPASLPEPAALPAAAQALQPATPRASAKRVKPATKPGRRTK
jgi:hypothetical protein